LHFRRRVVSNAIVLATAPLDAYATGVLSAFGQFKVSPDIKESTLAGMMDGVVALAVRGAAPITEAVLANAPALRVIGRTGVGYDSVDIAAATRRGIPVVYTPGAGARAVAEATFAFMLALCKQVTYWDQQLKAGNWNSRYDAQGGDLDGRTLGIVGLGRIGTLVAGIAKPFNMTVIAADPYLSAEDAATRGARLVPLETLLREADFISMHCPHNAETRGMINRARLSLVKPGSYFINLARGGVVDGLDPIYEALRSGQLSGAAIDVFDPSPPDVAHPLFQLPNCLTSPHAMATTAGAMTRIFKSMADDMAAILRGAVPQFVVNPDVLQR
jgi:D-3-phosphoglycerate dehydrogenase / 2-oxoglutarate reductase